MIFLLFCLSSPSAFAFAGGSGTSGDPYQISTVNHLQDVGNNLSSHFILVDNIDASGTSTWNGGDGFQPIGSDSNRFSGSFDGQGYVISNLYTNWQRDHIGLFGVIGSGGTVKNVGLESVSVEVSNSYYYAGGLAGLVYGEISKCYTTGSVTAIDSTGEDDLAGLVGWLESGASISNSYSTSDVSSTYNAGGLVSTNSQGTISKCYSTGTVSGGQYSSVGGLVGYNETSGDVTDSFWDTETSGRTSSAGGTGKTTSEMQSVATYTDTATSGLGSPWDFLGNPNDDTSSNEIWDINSTKNNGYPFLASVEWETNYSWSNSIYSEASWSNVLNWSGSITSSSASWSKIESWTNTGSSPVYWSNLEGWTGSVSAPVGWAVVDSWFGSVSAPVSWSSTDFWTGSVFSSDAYWSTVSSWSGSVGASDAVWDVSDSWFGSVSAPVSWSGVDSWSGSVGASDAVWGGVGSWSGSVSSPVSWSSTDTWTGSGSSSDAYWSGVDSWSGSVGASDAVWGSVGSWSGSVGASDAVWVGVGSWSGSVSSPVSWSSTDTWTGSGSSSDAYWSGVDSWTGSVSSPVIENIGVVSQPTLIYDSGDELDLSGLEVEENYSDGTSTVETFIDGTHEYYSTNPAHGTVLDESHDGEPIDIIHNENTELSAKTGTLTVESDAGTSPSPSPEPDLEYDLTINVEGQGSTNPEVGTHTYDNGAEVGVEATPEEGWEFENWSGDRTGTEENIIITMDGDKTITAVFEEESEVDLSEFEINDLNVIPEIVIPGENLKVSTTITNIGENTGERKVELLVDNYVEYYEIVELEADESTKVEFEVSRENKRGYKVKVDTVDDSMTSSFEVMPSAATPEEMENMTSEEVAENLSNSEPRSCVQTLENMRSDKAAEAIFYAYEQGFGDNIGELLLETDNKTLNNIFGEFSNEELEVLSQELSDQVQKRIDYYPIEDTGIYLSVIITIILVGIIALVLFLSYRKK